MLVDQRRILHSRELDGVMDGWMVCQSVRGEGPTFFLFYFYF